METKDARRTRKLGLLIDATAGGLDAIAIKAEVHPQYLKQIVKGVLLPPKRDGTRSPRALGDAAAEKIEDAYELGRGWFDSNRALPNASGVQEIEPPYPLNAWPMASVTRDQYVSLSDKSKIAIESMILNFLTLESKVEKYSGPEKRVATRR